MPQNQQHRVSISRGGLIGSVLVTLIALMCVRFGFWQLDRLEQKKARNSAALARLREPPVRVASSRLDSAGLIFRRAVVAGNYDHERTILIAGRSFNGVPGVHVLTPVRVGNSGVLVNRGWLPSTNPARLELDSIYEAAADDQRGLILAAPHDTRARNAEQPAAFRRVWYRPDLAALRTQFPYPLADYVVQLEPASNAPQQPVRLPRPVLDEGPHLGYAIQWFSFALIGVAGWLILLFRSGSLRTR